MLKKILAFFKKPLVEDVVSVEAVDAERNALMLRNEQRMAKIKEEMGERWVLHPKHKKSRLDSPRPV